MRQGGAARARHGVASASVEVAAKPDLTCKDAAIVAPLAPLPVSFVASKRGLVMPASLYAAGASFTAAAVPPWCAASSSLRIVTSVWTRPTPGRDEEWIKPSYVPQPVQTPVSFHLRGVEEGLPLALPRRPCCLGCTQAEELLRVIRSDACGSESERLLSATLQVYQPRRDDQPLYSPAPEFRPSELPDKPSELPSGPKMPERRPDPIPAGNPKVRCGCRRRACGLGSHSLSSLDGARDLPKRLVCSACLRQ